MLPKLYAFKVDLATMVDSIYLVSTMKIQHIYVKKACIQLFFGFASDIDQTNLDRDIGDGDFNRLSNICRICMNIGRTSLILNDVVHQAEDHYHWVLQLHRHNVSVDQVNRRYFHHDTAPPHKNNIFILLRS